MGALYWFGVFAAFAIAIVAVGAIAAGVGLVIYLALAGRAYIRALRSRDAHRIRDALLAPVVGVAVGLLFGDSAENGIRQLLKVFEDIQDNGSWVAGLAAGLILLSVLYGLLWVGVAFPFYVTSESANKRTAGYAICAFYGIVYAAVTILIIEFIACREAFPNSGCI
ncbi:hypothetical protein [Pseudonocardia sp.]|uniref:hypothetical protein n=1 Tax=Pseudonocardia sp. TaxID=60912 RepID=UPI003D099C5F